MTAGWVIAVPAWSDHYRSLFLGPALHSHMAAIEELRRAYRGSVRIRYVVQTDDFETVAKALRGFEVSLLPPPPLDSPYLAFVACHRHAIDTARSDERVCIMNADMVMSVEALAASETRFRQGKRAIIMAGTRTLAPRIPRRARWWGGFEPARKPFGPQPMKARELLSWSIDNAHPITRQCFWGEGSCHLPWGVYFQQGENIVLRAFHLHPFAVVKDRDLPFENTVDLAMVDHFSREEMHVVTDADEMALAEMSPPSKVFSDNPWPIDETSILGWALRGAGPTHWWNFGHRICVRGDPAVVTSDEVIVDTITRLNPYEGKDAA